MRRRSTGILWGIIVIAMIAVAFWAGSEYQESQGVSGLVEERWEEAGDRLEEDFEEIGDRMAERMDE